MPKQTTAAKARAALQKGKGGEGKRKTVQHSWKLYVFVSNSNKVQAASFKFQASSVKFSIFKCQVSNFTVSSFKFQVSNFKFQASSFKFQMSSFKCQVLLKLET